MTVLFSLVLTLDAGTPPAGPRLRGEDLEVVENLELLENLESSADFELLQELSLER